jgi:hypothetical protein
VVQFGGSGKAFQRLAFPALGRGRTDKWLIYGGTTCSQPTVTKKLNFRSSGDAAGVVFAWSDANSRISVIPNLYWGTLQFYEFVGGSWRTRAETGRGTLPLKANTDYWMRVITSSDNGVNTATVWWSSDGSSYSPIFTSGPLVNVSGQVGLQTQGENLPNVVFDDFSLGGACK